MKKPDTLIDISLSKDNPPIDIGSISQSKRLSIQPLDIHTPQMTDIYPKKYLLDDLDIATRPILSIREYTTLQTRDISLPITPVYTDWRKYVYTPWTRPDIIDLGAPLHIPEGAVDIRTGNGYILEKKYPDLYARPVSKWRRIRSWWRVHTPQIRTFGRYLAYTLLLVCIVTLPLLYILRYALLDAYTRLLHIPTLSTPTQLRTEISTIRQRFEQVSLFMYPLYILDNPLWSVDTIRLARLGIHTGQSISRHLDILSRDMPDMALSQSGIVDEIFESNTYRTKPQDIYPLARYGIDDPVGYILRNREEIHVLLADISYFSTQYATIDHIPVARYDSMYQSAKISMQYIARYASIYLRDEDILLKMIGSQSPQRYMLFNQNRDEIRANGGFPGSVITFTMHRGNVIDMRKEDIYYYDWNLYPNKETPPPGISTLSNNFGLRDATYYPDFRDSLEKANIFVEKSGETTLNMGIAINQGIVEDILHITGPISLSGTTYTLDENNFSLVMSTLVEAKYAKIDTPKDILFRFMHTLVDTGLQQKKLQDILPIIEKNIRTGDIQIASRDPEIEAYLDNMGYVPPYMHSMSSGGMYSSGNIYPDYVLSATSSGKIYTGSIYTGSANWIYPLLTNIGGNKTDRITDRAYTLMPKTVRTSTGCTTENVFTILSTHRYDTKLEKEIYTLLDGLGISDRETRTRLLDIEGNGTNKTFVRLLVPTGAVLASTAKNISIKEGSDTSGYTYSEIAFTIDTPPRSSSEKTIRYNLPTVCTDTGVVYRQPGSR